MRSAFLGKSLWISIIIIISSILQMNKLRFKEAGQLSQSDWAQIRMQAVRLQRLCSWLLLSSA